jgi:hypothetical protein
MYDQVRSNFGKSPKEYRLQALFPVASTPGYCGMFMIEKEVSDYLYVITKACFQHTVMYPAGVEEEWLQLSV